MQRCITVVVFGMDIGPLPEQYFGGLIGILRRCIVQIVHSRFFEYRLFLPTLLVQRRLFLPTLLVQRRLLPTLFLQRRLLPTLLLLLGGESCFFCGLLLTLLFQRDLFGVINIHLAPNQHSNYAQSYGKSLA